MVRRRTSVTPVLYNRYCRGLEQRLGCVACMLRCAGACVANPCVFGCFMYYSVGQQLIELILFVVLLSDLKQNLSYLKLILCVYILPVSMMPSISS